MGYLGGGIPIPDNLDAEKDEDNRIFVKLIFDSFGHYSKHEEEIKAFAEDIGAEFGLIKG